MEQDSESGAGSLKGKRGLSRLINASRYSLMGLRTAFVNEDAFRQVVFINMLLQPLALWLDVSRAERALLMLAPLLSLVIELLNTAIENTVDRISMELHPLSKAAKDVGSAAQMIGLLIIVVVWSVILL
ncbi:diacylglycerol kinase [Luminiphilus syltensis NOR5-1B]|uniref:Diacylglycerol kinase n=1 Tax=Luminiphilus syltensis NOR5-1B TaxID=565045 RepID=B8KTJ9_9GAMM|nr:diacylglycerol kinase [Luminiphilus syltensis]EED34186.1 diacylglycerol kinase [Luminiphilus syltensis NOR5-1B]